ncbi:hypothetical protein Tco_1193992 [Tanacetum coccineum]
MNSSNPNPSCRPTKVEVLKELPKVRMVNTSLMKLKHHLAGFDVVVKEITTTTAITEGSWGFEHTKACFRDEIIPFVKALKDFVRNKLEIDTLSLDDLYNNLKIYEPEVKGTSSSSTITQNVAFVSSNSTSSTNGLVNNAYGATTAST